MCTFGGFLHLSAQNRRAEHRKNNSGDVGFTNVPGWFCFCEHRTEGQIVEKTMKVVTVLPEYPA